MLLEEDDEPISQLGPIQEYENDESGDSDGTSLIQGDTSLQNVIDTTIPSDVLDDDLENILPDFISQLEMGGTKCK